MIAKRIIPCLDVRDGRVVKGVNFLGLRDVSSPVALARYYSESGADELVFYDITASAEGRALFTDILREVASTIFIPLTVGGGIRSLADFERVLTHALRRGCGGRVLLSMMADGSLRLTGTKDPDIAFGAVLLDLTAPVVPCSEESLALRVQVIDWRRCARCYDEALAQRTRHSLP